IEALIAYDIDFPEEDDGPVSPARTEAALDALESAIRALLATSHAGELVREGAMVVLAGAPNVGKSSLFNAIIGRNRAIVTDVPGTTRDALEVVIDARPWPLRLVDTAGLGPAVAPVRQLGVRMRRSYLRRAALVLACGDDAGAVRDAARAVDRAFSKERGGAAPVVLVRTKTDISSEAATVLDELRDELGAATAVGVSAETGEGIAQL